MIRLFLRSFASVLVFSLVRTVITPVEFEEHRVALIVEVLMNPNVRPVITVYRESLDGHEELFFDLFRMLLVAADFAQQGFLLLPRTFREILVPAIPSQPVERAQPFLPETLFVFISNGDHLVNKLV